MRVFYAVNFDGETAAALRGFQDELRGHVRRGRWARLENLHLTLHFVGEIRPEELPLFTDALDFVAASAPPFTLRFTSFGSFRQGRQDLLYVKTKNTGGTLESIADSLKRRLQRGDMHSFVPHVTLVRRAEISWDTLKVLKKRRFDLPPVNITSIELMESRKSDGCLTYIPLHSCILGGVSS